MGKIQEKIKANQDIRDRMKRGGIKQWEVAERIGIDEFRFSRILRTELDADDREMIEGAIRELENEVE